MESVTGLCQYKWRRGSHTCSCISTTPGTCSTQISGSQPQSLYFSRLGGSLRPCISNELPDEAIAAGQGPHFANHGSKCLTCPEKGQDLTSPDRTVPTRPVNTLQSLKPLHRPLDLQREVLLLGCILELCSFSTSQSSGLAPGQLNRNGGGGWAVLSSFSSSPSGQALL